MQPSVFGVETEYTCLITLPGSLVYELVGSCHSPDTKIGLYHEPSKNGSSDIAPDKFAVALNEMGIKTNEHGMLSNGGRFYIDPSGPEYDTPETTSAEEAVHRSFDGDEILLGVFEALRRRGAIEGYQLNRRIVDHNRASRGIHLNTMSTLEADEPSYEIKKWLATLNVAKGAIFGSGGLLVDEYGQTAYHHSPRLSLTSDVAMPYRDYRRRPLVRYPFKEEGAYSRIETITSDVLNFAWPLRASLVLTDAVVNVIETGHGHDLPVLRDPVRAAHTVGRFGNDKQVSLESRGKRFIKLRPLDVIRDICETVLDVDYVEEFSPETRQVVGEVIDVADKMAHDTESVAGQVESVARWIALQKKMDTSRLKIDAERICRFDYAWDWLGGGIAEGLRKSNKAGWLGFESGYCAADTKRRITDPPKDTRALIRGNMIAKGRGDAIAEWYGIADDEEMGSTYVHPLKTSLGN